MPKMDKNGTCPEIRSELQKNSFSKLVFNIQGDSIRLVSAAISAPPLAVATLIFGSDSKVAPNNTRGPDGLRSLQSEDVNCTSHETTFQHSRLRVESV